MQQYLVIVIYRLFLTLLDPDLMPAELRAAHRENDRAVEAAYGLPSDSDEADIVSHLFALYAAKTR